MAERVGELLARATKRLALCSNDPICAEHSEGSEDYPLQGAACHACLLVPETSCEARNTRLDRGLLTQTVLGADFLCWVKAIYCRLLQATKAGMASQIRSASRFRSGACRSGPKFFSRSPGLDPLGFQAASIGPNGLTDFGRSIRESLPPPLNVTVLPDLRRTGMRRASFGHRFVSSLGGRYRGMVRPAARPISTRRRIASERDAIVRFSAHLSTAARTCFGKRTATAGS